MTDDPRPKPPIGRMPALLGALAVLGAYGPSGLNGGRHLRREPDPEPSDFLPPSPAPWRGLDPKPEPEVSEAEQRRRASIGWPVSEATQRKREVKARRRKAAKKRRGR